MDDIGRKNPNYNSDHMNTITTRFLRTTLTYFERDTGVPNHAKIRISKHDAYVNVKKKMPKYDPPKSHLVVL